MNFSTIENAFAGRAYKNDEPVIMPTYHTVEKEKLIKEFKKEDVKNVPEERKINKYETPLIMINENNYLEGKWRDNPENKEDGIKYNGVTNGSSQNYPYPYMQDQPFFDKRFINKLKSVMQANKKYAIPYNHVDQCRLCFKPLGNKEYVLQKNGITIRVYESNLHYYMRHNVWPSKFLYEFIMNY